MACLCLVRADLSLCCGMGELGWSQGRGVPCLSLSLRCAFGLSRRSVEGVVKRGSSHRFGGGRIVTRARCGECWPVSKAGLSAKGCGRSLWPGT